MTRLHTALGPLEAAALGAVMDDVCVRAPLSKDKRKLTACEQMGQVLSAAYGRPFDDHDEEVVAADASTSGSSSSPWPSTSRQHVRSASCGHRCRWG